MQPGTKRFPPEFDVLYSRIFAGVAWPALRAGFVVVVGEHRTEYSAGLPKLVVLDEASDERLWHVVEKAAALQFYYKPERVLADTHHVAAMQFVSEFAKKGLQVEGSLLCAMEGPCNYAFPVLNRLKQQGRLDVPTTLKLAGEMMTPPPHEDLRKLLLSDYPGIAALAFAVIELERTREDSRQKRPTEVEPPGRILE